MDPSNNPEEGNQENEGSPAASSGDEFDFYFQFTKPLVLDLPTPEERAIAAAWVQKLEAEPETEQEKKRRLDYLKLLLFVLQRGHLSGIFKKQPAPGPLQPFPQGFTMSDMGNLMIDQDELQSFGGGDARSVPYTIEISNDLREFVAAQEVPNFGVQMYYAWSSDEPVHKWTLFDEDKFPSHVLEKIKQLKEIKSDEKTAATKGCNVKKGYDLPLLEKTSKTKVKSPQEIEKAQGRSFQTYVGLVGRMGSGFKDKCDVRPEQRQKCPKKTPQKRSPGCQTMRGGAEGGEMPQGDDYDNFLSGLSGSNPVSCRCPIPYHAPDCEAMQPGRPMQPAEEQRSPRMCPQQSRAENVSPSWNAQAQGPDCGNRRPAQSPACPAEQSLACPPSQRGRQGNSRSPSPNRMSEFPPADNGGKFHSAVCICPSPPCVCPCPHVPSDACRLAQEPAKTDGARCSPKYKQQSFQNREDNRGAGSRGASPSGALQNYSQQACSVQVQRGQGSKGATPSGAPLSCDMQTCPSSLEMARAGSRAVSPVGPQGFNQQDQCMLKPTPQRSPNENWCPGDEAKDAQEKRKYTPAKTCATGTENARYSLSPPTLYQQSQSCSRPSPNQGSSAFPPGNVNPVTPCKRSVKSDQGSRRDVRQAQLDSVCPQMPNTVPRVGPSSRPMAQQGIPYYNSPPPASYSCPAPSPSNYRSAQQTPSNYNAPQAGPMSYSCPAPTSSSSRSTQQVPSNYNAPQAGPSGLSYAYPSGPSNYCPPSNFNNMEAGNSLLSDTQYPSFAPNVGRPYYPESPECPGPDQRTNQKISSMYNVDLSEYNEVYPQVFIDNARRAERQKAEARRALMYSSQQKRISPSDGGACALTPGSKQKSDQSRKVSPKVTPCQQRQQKMGEEGMAGSSPCPAGGRNLSPNDIEIGRSAPGYKFSPPSPMYGRQPPPEFGGTRPQQGNFMGQGTVKQEDFPCPDEERDEDDTLTAISGISSSSNECLEDTALDMGHKTLTGNAPNDVRNLTPPAQELRDGGYNDFIQATGGKFMTSTPTKNNSHTCVKGSSSKYMEDWLDISAIPKEPMMFTDWSMEQSPEQSPEQPFARESPEGGYIKVFPASMTTIDNTDECELTPGGSIRRLGQQQQQQRQQPQQQHLQSPPQPVSRQLFNSPREENACSPQKPGFAETHERRLRLMDEQIRMHLQMQQMQQMDQTQSSDGTWVSITPRYCSP